MTGCPKNQGYRITAAPRVCFLSLFFNSCRISFVNFVRSRRVSGFVFHLDCRVLFFNIYEHCKILLVVLDIKQNFLSWIIFSLRHVPLCESVFETLFFCASASSFNWSSPSIGFASEWIRWMWSFVILTGKQLYSGLLLCFFVCIHFCSCYSSLQPFFSPLVLLVLFLIILVTD